MFITVEDALKLPSFSTASVIAGAKGLNRRIYRVSVVECPEFPIDVSIAGRNNLLFMDGDFLITSFYAIKDSIGDMLETIKLYNQFNSSGICIVRRYIEEIPQEVIDYANENAYPVLFISKEVAYASMISDIMRSIYGQYNQQAVFELMDKILSGSYHGDELKKLAYSLYSGFKNHIMAFCIKILKDEDVKHGNYLIRRINSNQLFYCVRYYDKIIAFSTQAKKFKDSLKDSIKNEITEIIDACKLDYCMGISGPYNGLHNIKKVIESAIDACDMSGILEQKIVNYEDIGMYKLIMKVKDKDFLLELFEGLIKPITEYDRKNNSNLLETLICFVKNDASINNTAKELYQHSNTIRYRVDKIRELLGVKDNNIKFYEDINMIYKLYIMYNREEKLLI
ncbi:PucR family transcriptional regulator [Lutispora thermophila]|uniref:PucR C-terminal helix-turn-helix domain-containing protein n=1 Tax=Lutispora thermophila DSM 19022 TaxID=1122184 RepID=A0A1M6DR72_9FIRM|nr:PucR family transcriptional regulator ligand-binding domain-containing protein [Lutispora thermophila]SHI75711.1 PucR C-terminal helix-turn-helix domain-containing protein [Lutispora thermophila DSM 19022]